MSDKINSSSTQELKKVILNNGEISFDEASSLIDLLSSKTCLLLSKDMTCNLNFSFTGENAVFSLDNGQLCVSLMVTVMDADNTPYIIPSISILNNEIYVNSSLPAISTPPEDLMASMTDPYVRVITNYLHYSVLLKLF